MWTLTRKKPLIFSAVCHLSFAVAALGFLTFPPAQQGGMSSDAVFKHAKEEFFSGNLDSAYKNLLLSGSLKDEEEWRKFYCLTLIGLNRPVDAAAYRAGIKSPSEGEKKRLKYLLDRQGIERAYPRFKASGAPVSVSKEICKKARAVAMNNGSVFVLTDTALIEFDPGGKFLESAAFSDGRELLSGGESRATVLTGDCILTQSKKIVLPLEIVSAVSFARAPGGCFYVLDSANKVFLISREGSLLQERRILIKKPRKIRTDELFRVFILSAQDEVFVYSASFEPITVLSQKLRDAGTGSVSDIFTDFAGDLIFGGGGAQLFFFNFNQDFLGKSVKDDFRADIVWWNGEDTVLTLDKKRGVIRKIVL